MTDTANAPERIWMTAEDHGASWSGAFRTFRCSNLDHSNDDGPNPDYPEYVLATRCDEMVAAAYLDARESVNDYPREAPSAVVENAYYDQIEYSQSIIDTRTPDNARAALTAYGERMKAEAAREAQAKIARMEASLEILRDNPAAVHLNMLKGNIAKPTWEQIKHLYRAEFNLLQENANE